MTAQEFICEEIAPVAGTADVAGMARGEPGLPARFAWRGQEYRIAGLIRQWKTSGPCRSGGRKVYLRRHWYEVLTDPPRRMTLYCDRQAKNRKRPKARWWAYTVGPAGGAQIAGQTWIDVRAARANQAARP
jgi:hypothetical protein